MAKIQAEILESFYKELTKVDNIDQEMLKKLRELFSSGKKLKADDIVAVFTQEPESDTS